MDENVLGCAVLCVLFGALTCLACVCDEGDVIEKGQRGTCSVGELNFELDSIKSASRLKWLFYAPAAILVAWQGLALILG